MEAREEFDKIQKELALKDKMMKEVDDAKRAVLQEKL